MLTAFSLSRKYSAYARRLGDPSDGEDVSARAHVNPEALGGRVDASEGRAHRLFERVADAVFRPEVAVLILHPLVITNRYAARVRKDVGHEEDAAVEEHAVGGRRDGAVREFGDDGGAHALDVRERDAVLKRRREKYVAVNLKNFVARYGRRVRQALNRARLGLVAERGLHADAARAGDARARVCHGDH